MEEAAALVPAETEASAAAVGSEHGPWHDVVSNTPVCSDEEGEDEYDDPSPLLRVHTVTVKGLGAAASPPIPISRVRYVHTH
jgi:hypothetical protein